MDLSRVQTERQIPPGGLLRRLAMDTAKILGVVLALSWAINCYPLRLFGHDSHAYWLAWRSAMYTTAPMTRDAYLYSPAFAQVLRPLTTVPWPLFAVMWSILLGLVLVWLLLPLRWWAVPLWAVGLPEIASGNVFILLAVVAVLGLRHRWVWTFALLTKVTLGLGPVWFAVRREWRQFGVTMGVTGGVALLSYVLAPHLWMQWIQFLMSHVGASGHPLGSVFGPALLYRLPVALVLVAWGATADRRWVLPVGMVLASPVLWFGTFAVLAALPRLQRRSSPAADIVPLNPQTSS